jgi:glycosyltransferase 2 family protein
MESPLKKAFGGWKITLAIVFGLAISGFVLFLSLSKTQFVECDNNTGDYEWVDANNNQQVDWEDSAEFKKVPSGNYRLQTVSDALAQIKWSSYSYAWIAAALFFMVSRDFFYMVRIRLLTKNQLTWKASFYVILLWEFASAVSPGVVGGAAVAMFILNRETIPFGKATAIVIITAFMDNLFFVLMIPLVFLFVHSSTLFPADESSSLALTWWFWVGFSIILSVCLLLYLTLFWFPKLATSFLLFIFKLPFLRRWKFIAAEWGKDIERASKEFKQEPRHYWIKVFLATFASWISRYLVINAILNAFLDLGFLDNMRVLGKQLVLWLFMLVSPTPGGSGVAEYAFGELLSSVSTSMILLVALAVLWRLISYFPYLFIGAFLLPAWIKRTRG